MKQVLSFLTAITFILACATSLAAEPMEDSNESKVVAIVEQVNINVADAETIAAALHRVGLKRAQDIVAWREANGRFSSLEQLLEIRGIGEATLENNRDRILL